MQNLNHSLEHNVLVYRINPEIEFYILGLKNELKIKDSLNFNGDS